MRGLQKNKGITLIALIVTVIILLILAAISVSMISGSGLFNRSKSSVSEFQKATAEEKLTLFLYEWSMDNIESGKTLLDFLEEKFIDGQIQDYEETAEGIDIYIDGYVVTVNESGEIIGEIQEAVARPQIVDGSLNVTLENGNTITKRQEIGVKLKVQFRVAVDGGTITSIEGLTGATINTETGEVTYTTTGTELELLFRVKGNVNGIESKSNKKISLTNYYEVTLEAESLLKAIGDNEFANDEVCKVLVNGQLYKMRIYNYNTNLTISENTTFGKEEDVATSTTDAKNMVVLKVNGNLTVNEGVKVEPYYTQYGGPKGFTIYVTGTLTNNGTIDNSHGAKAVGQDVYLWKNANGEYEKVPAQGALGGNGINNIKSGVDWKDDGNSGTHGQGRETGGGAGGQLYGGGSPAYTAGGTSGNGTRGTSYSGGSGGGGATGVWTTVTSDNAQENGGKGGNAKSSYGSGYTAAGGTGNPGGTGAEGTSTSATYNGNNGTGGLLIIYANSIATTGNITAKGTVGKAAGSSGSIGGPSGGGSVNIFTNNYYETTSLGAQAMSKYNEILQKINVSGGSNTTFAGGNGTINLGEINNNQYFDLQEAIRNRFTKNGNSILEILEDDTLVSGNYTFNVNGETYLTHLYVFDENTTFTQNQTFGNESDISRDIAATATTSAYREYAQKMVIVKVNGDLTINSGVTVAPFYTQYGGPKGFTIYVTGTLTNNGTIDNSHGAYALGQDVYLWKNANGEYEKVPAQGALGGNGTSNTKSDVSSWREDGNSGKHGQGRETGGGAGGQLYGNGSASHTSGGTSGSGSRGTSYSGGSGGGGATGTWTTVTSDNAQENGGKGGNAKSSYGSGYTAAGGTGNPGGTGADGTSISANYNGNNGTGGLLIIYANSINNTGDITAKGTVGKSAGNSGAVGGSSGGGSVNVFYKSECIKGRINVNGGIVGTIYGGTGTVTIGNISTGTFVKDN